MKSKGNTSSTPGIGRKQALPERAIERVPSGKSQVWIKIRAGKS